MGALADDGGEAEGGEAAAQKRARSESSVALRRERERLMVASERAAIAAAAAAREAAQSWEEQPWDATWTHGHVCSEKAYRWQRHDEERAVVELDAKRAPEGRLESSVLTRIEVDFEGVEVIVGDVGKELVALRVAALRALVEQRFCDMDVHARLGALCIEDLHRPRAREALGFAPQSRLFLLNSHPGHSAMWSDGGTAAIAAGDAVSMTVHVPSPGGTLRWSFLVRDRNLDFCVRRRQMGDVGGAVEVDIVAKVRYESSTGMVHGNTIVNTNAATMVLVFDNKFSWMREKHVAFKYEVLKPGTSVSISATPIREVEVQGAAAVGAEAAAAAPAVEAGDSEGGAQAEVASAPAVAGDDGDEEAEALFAAVDALSMQEDADASRE